MASSLPPDGDTPVSSMNMTPLIDVLLVLLVMFIITIPIATHSVEVDIGGDDTVLPTPDPVINKLAITGEDELLWNSERISEGQLVGLLKATRQMKLEPELQFEPEAQASYAASAKALQIVKASGVTKFGFVGNEKYQQFASGQ